MDIEPGALVKVDPFVGATFDWDDLLTTVDAADTWTMTGMRTVVLPQGRVFNYELDFIVITIILYYVIVYL